MFCSILMNSLAMRHKRWQIKIIYHYYPYNLVKPYMHILKHQKMASRKTHTNCNKTVANFQVSELGFWRGEWSSGETNYMFKNMLNAIILLKKVLQMQGPSEIWDQILNKKKKKKKKKENFTQCSWILCFKPRSNTLRKFNNCLLLAISNEH